MTHPRKSWQPWFRDRREREAERARRWAESEYRFRLASIWASPNPDDELQKLIKELSAEAPQSNKYWPV